MKQADIAKATQGVVTESWISKFESEHRPKYPTRDQLEPLAAPLGTTLAYLLAPMRVAPLEDVLTPDARTAAESAIMNSDLTEERKAAALTIIRDLFAASEKAG